MNKISQCFQGRRWETVIGFLIAVFLSVGAQNRTIKGNITDAADGQPLIGATVQAKGGSQGAVSDLDGNFTLQLPASVKQVVVSYIGYEPSMWRPT